MFIDQPHRYLKLTVQQAINSLRVDCGNILWIDRTTLYDETPLLADTPASLTLDLGADRGVAPTGIRLKLGQTIDTAPMTFTCSGSNDLQTWTTLYSAANLTAEDYSGPNTDKEFPFMIPVSGIVLNTTLLRLRVGQTLLLTATVFPADATCKDVTWSSSHGSAATVDFTGRVTAHSVGATTITATAIDGGQIATALVIVDPAAGTAPSSTVQLAAAHATTTSASLSWTVSPLAGVTYEVYQESTLLGTTPATTYSVLGLSENTQHRFTVIGRDATGVAIASNTLTMKTNDPCQLACTENVMGINLLGVSDWFEDRLFANAMKQAREWKRPDGSLPAIDENGWPLEDAGCIVWHGIGNMHGTYRLSFTGTATLSTSYGGATILNQTHDANTNTTTADLIYQKQDGAGLYLTFTNTQGGVKNVKLMRPLRPGASESHDPIATFSQQIKQAIAKFSVIRFMDYSATNSNQQVNWSDRVSPTYCSFSRTAPGYGWQGKGGAWEYAIQLCNETGRNAWICVPAKVTDDYVRNLALLWRDGGGEFAGLNPDLTLYVEYSNELWNTSAAFTQTSYNHQQAIAEVQAGGSPLNYDGNANTWFWAWRRAGKRIVEISQIFRRVFGDAAMMTRIRPVLAWQQGNGQSMAAQALTFVENYYNNQSGNFVTQPRPINYYVWGGGGSAYYHPENRNPELTIDTIWNSGTMNIDKWYELQNRDAELAASFGLTRVAYEGGDSFDKCNCPADAAKIAAVNDPRITQAIIDHHNAWSRWGGDLLMYFNIAGDFQWGFTSNIFDLDTPKYRAIDALNQSKQVDLTQGTLIPATIEGNRWSASSRSWGTPGAGALKIDPGIWFAYSIRVNQAGTYRITIEYRSTATATLRVYLSSQPLGDVLIPNTNNVIQTSPFFNVALQANQLYAVRVRSLSGTFNCVKLNLAAEG